MQDHVSEQLVRDFIERHNAAVRSGDYGPLGELFAPDAELQFRGVSLGPCRGRNAIVQIFSARGPDDELVLTDLQTAERRAMVKFNWQRGGDHAGTAELHHDGERITGNWDMVHDATLVGLSESPIVAVVPHALVAPPVRERPR